MGIGNVYGREKAYQEKDPVGGTAPHSRSGRMMLVTVNVSLRRKNPATPHSRGSHRGMRRMGFA
jgi:hypothetical protein